MPDWLIITIVAVVFSFVAAWVVRKLLDSRVWWLRALLTSAVVFLLSLPIALWSLDEADVLVDGVLVVSNAIAVLFIALTAGWMFAVVVIVVLALEFLWPSRPLRNPITVVREALRRRDRARRYAQIVAIGSRNGLGFYESRRRGSHDDRNAALIAAMNEAGVTFVKLGQVLSSREDVLPPSLIDALSTLQMDSTPIPWSEAEAAITQQLGRPISDVFSEIDRVPLAAASVAQVHTARLRTGEEVIVKIQRPRARAEVTTDLDILERLAGEAERRTEWAKDYGTLALAEEFSRALREELDYRIEAANTEMLRGAIAAAPSSRLRVPKLYREYGTSQMLVQERATGIALSRLKADDLPSERAVEIADSLLDAVFDQIAVRGVFHADLHPGNVLLDVDAEGGGTLTLIDFGAVGILERSMRRLLLPMLVGMANEDDVAVTDVVLLMCTPPAGAQIDTVALQHDIGVILTRVHNSRADGNIFRLLLDVLRRNRLALPPSLLLVFRTLASLEGTLRKLVPDYDMVARALEIAPDMARASFSPQSMLLTAQTWATLVGEQVRRMPRRIESITRSLDEGSLSVKTRTFAGPAERSWVDGLLANITTTVIGITLIVTGIMLGVSDGGPMITGNVPAFAFIGSVMGLAGLLLLLRSLRTTYRRG